jgi:hypothetical protein
VCALLRQLRQFVYEVEAIIEPNGQHVAPDGSEKTSAAWCPFVARKTGRAADDVTLQ